MPINLRKDSDVHLLGQYKSQIVGSKLPSKGDVLRVLFFNLRAVNLNLRDSAKLVINEVMVFWCKARIPTQQEIHCVEKLEKMYETWRNFKKSERKTGEEITAKRRVYKAELNDLFDIAHKDALKKIKIEEDRQFLINQRKKGRQGSMYGIDRKLAKKEKAVEERKQKRADQARRSAEAIAKMDKKCTLSSNSDGSKTSGEDGSEEETSGAKPRKTRARVNVMTPRIMAALDKCKISDYDSVHILTAVAEALGHDPTNLSINRSTVRRSRIDLRKHRDKALKERFGDLDLKAAVIHFDGKLFNDLTKSQKYDRLAVIITSGDFEQILGIPGIESGTGRDQSNAMYELILKWGLLGIIKAICCDTTSSNLGRLQGAVILLEQLLEMDLLYLPCRHHIPEIVLRSAFDIKMPASTGPDVPLFKQFKEFWHEIDKSKFVTSVKDKTVNSVLTPDERSNTLDFIEEQLSRTKQPRDDYKEFLTLSKLFLGKVDDTVTISPPGPIHHARWMAKALYCLKIYLFKAQFKLTKTESAGITDICIFIVKVYLKYWFLAPLAAKAPALDLQFLKDLIDYQKVDTAISQATVAKFQRHLWYLTPETAALAFFDEDISVDSKKKMVTALKKADSFEANEKRIQLANLKDVKSKDISDFISCSSKNLFNRFELPMNFLKEDPTTWQKNQQYNENRVIVKKLKVVNDVAERGIKLIEEYNSILTKDEEERQIILRIVSDYRKTFPNARKETLRKKF